MTTKQVHLTDLDGALVYTRMLDDGGPILTFESGYGFVAKSELVRERLVVRPGWPMTQAHRDHLARRATA